MSRIRLKCAVLQNVWIKLMSSHQPDRALNIDVDWTDWCYELFLVALNVVCLFVARDELNLIDTFITQLD